jgi:hypothetical protein
MKFLWSIIEYIPMKFFNYIEWVWEEFKEGWDEEIRRH